MRLIRPKADKKRIRSILSGIPVRNHAKPPNLRTTRRPPASTWRASSSSCPPHHDSCPRSGFPRTGSCRPGMRPTKDDGARCDRCAPAPALRDPTETPRYRVSRGCGSAVWSVLRRFGTTRMCPGVDSTANSRRRRLGCRWMQALPSELGSRWTRFGHGRGRPWRVARRRATFPAGPLTATTSPPRPGILANEPLRPPPRRRPQPPH